MLYKLRQIFEPFECYDKYYSPKSKVIKGDYKKVPLSKKQKQNRNKSKLAKQARKQNR